ncbi:hypothetical protein D9M69_719070 [compost metagenome]
MPANDAVAPFASRVTSASAAAASSASGYSASTAPAARQRALSIGSLSISHCCARTGPMRRDRKYELPASGDSPMAA